MQEQLRELITKHCTTLANELAAMDACFKNISQPGAECIDAVKEGIEHAHKIKGSSGSIGFPEISAAAASLEFCFRDIAASNAAVSPAQQEKLVGCYGDLARLIGSVKPQQSTLYNI